VIKLFIYLFTKAIFILHQSLFSLVTLKTIFVCRHHDTIDINVVTKHYSATSNWNYSQRTYLGIDKFAIFAAVLRTYVTQDY